MVGRKDRPTALVLGMTPNGLGVVRSLGRQGVPVISVHPNKVSTMCSRYCESIVSPDVETEEDRFLDFLLDKGRRLDQPGILFPTGDAYVHFVSENRELLGKYYRFAMPDKNTMRQLLNKKTQYILAEDLGVPLPVTFCPSSFEQLKEVTEKVNYPAIIKPLYSIAWRRRFGVRKVMNVTSGEELLEAYKEVQHSGIEAVIQEAILGGDDRCYKICSYMNKESEPILTFTLRKIRNYPCDFGVGSCVESTWMPEVADLGLKFLKGVQYVGVGSIEFKRDKRDDELKMIELNSRLWWQNSLAEKCGLNFPYTMYMDLIGNKVEMKSAFREGIKWVSMSSDSASFKGYHARGQLGYMEWLKSLKGEKVFEIFARDDPKPFFHSIEYGMKLLRKVFKKLINFHNLKVAKPFFNYQGVLPRFPGLSRRGKFR